jgi:hypothetical protein
MKYLVSTLFCFMAVTVCAWGQDDLLKQLEQNPTEVDGKVTGTFKGTRLINGHSIETREKGNLDFIISHRFGRLNSGAYSLFGLDDSNIRLGLDYAVTDQLTLGLGRNSLSKVYDGFIKYKLLQQQTSRRSIPVSLVWFSNMSITTFRRPELSMNFQRKLGYTHQLLIARRFNESLSLQLSPSFVHRNLVPLRAEDNDLYALGIGGRYKITPRTSLNVEYFHRLGEQVPGTYNALAIGFDIETGGHVFQLHLTNAQAMTETGFIPSTGGDFFGGDIHFGFNISRSFQVGKR